MREMCILFVRENAINSKSARSCLVIHKFPEEDHCMHEEGQQAEIAHDGTFI